jgi:3-hydroxybutyryl-CoA dehydrogenase
VLVRLCSAGALTRRKFLLIESSTSGLRASSRMVLNFSVLLIQGRLSLQIQRVGVVGAGTMGNGIAHVFARSAFDVVLCDVKQEFLDWALETIARNLDREAAKGKISTDEKSLALKRIHPVVDRNKLADCDFVVEAATEKFEIKSEVFRDLDRICRPEVLLASNTSSISITKLAAVTKRPDKIIGMHFFNPVPIMKLVEVVRGLATSDETFHTVHELARKLDKTPVEVNDAPGFVSNRVLMPLLNEAMFAVMEDVATPEAVDEVFKLGMAHPMGPLALADFIGLDVCLDIMRVLHDGLGDPKYRPCPLLVKMVDAGWLGKKSGRGFYKYLS